MTFHVGGVEYFDGSDSSNGAFDDGGGDTGLFAFVREEGAREALGEGLDEHEERAGGGDDESEGP